MDREAEFLREQAAIARIRLRLHASALRDDVLTPLDLAPFVRRRPWWSVGGAALGGFLSGIGLRSLVRAPRRGPAGRVSRLAAAAARRARGLLGSAIGSAILANLRDAARSEAPPRANGHTPSPPSSSPSSPPPSPPAFPAS